MSEDRLEKALEAMKSESIVPEQLAEARTHVWEKLEAQGLTACAEFQPGFRDYLENRLAGNRRLLMEDHLSRCTSCRAQFAGLKGEHKTIAMPHRRAWWPRWGTWAAAAALVLLAFYLGRDRLDTLLAPSGPRATVASVHGGLYRLADGAIQSNAPIGEGEVIRTGPGARAVLKLADGSMVDVNERSELFLSAAWSGQTIHLQRGDIIVQAAKQRRGHLRVQTRDSVASVRGTVFAVSSGLGGTVVSVVEGSVAVSQPGTEVMLSPGQQAASNPVLANSVQQAISWSPDAETYMTLLASLVKIDKQMAAMPQPALRTQARLLECLPPNVVVYGAIPNLTGTISQAMSLFEQESAGSPTFQTWWNSPTGQELKQLVGRIQAVTPLLGDEVVFVFSKGPSGTNQQIPMVVAQVQPGKRSELANALEALRSQAGEVPLLFSLNDALIVISDTQDHLQWILSHMGQSAATPFAQAIAARYQRGAGWLLGMDIEATLPASTVPVEAAVTGAPQMKHLFLEQRTFLGAEQNEVTLTFKGPRMGMASWLANSGSGGAAEYISADAPVALYLSTREPRQLFDEITGQLIPSNPSSGQELAAVEAKLGAGFAADLASAFGTESAFALEGLSVNGPVWVMTFLVNAPSVVDASVHKLVDVINGTLPAAEQDKRIILEEETADGRTWTTLKSGLFPLSVTWTYDRGYLVAASDRAAASRAIATRSGGSPLISSAAFLQQLPSTELHPSGFAWLNTKGAFQSFASLAPSPAFKQLLTERDPILAVFDGTTEQIHAASRIRISGLVIDLMMLESLSRARPGALITNLQQGSTSPGIR
jgi:hypothetical protein